jgi:hypothetical protein
MKGSRKRVGIALALLPLGWLLASCASDVPTSWPLDEPTTAHDLHTETDRAQSYLNSRYTSADVRHSFTTMAGQTVDCIDYLAQPAAKLLAARGTPLTEIPRTPPPPPARAKPRSRDPAFGSLSTQPLDENGQTRACPKGTVPIVRISLDEILGAGGLDAYQARKRSRPSPVHPPRPRVASNLQATTPISRLSTSAPTKPSQHTAPPTEASQQSPPAPGWCTEFETTDIPYYAHVQQTAYPSESFTWGAANATISLFQPNLTSYSTGSPTRPSASLRGKGGVNDLEHNRAAHLGSRRRRRRVRRHGVC